MAFTRMREAAYLALLKALKDESFIHVELDKWRQASRPLPIDFNLAQEIAYGSCRMALALDFIAAALTDKGKLNIKLKEKALMRTALYQHFFMEKIPLYAVVNESMKIAKKHCHPSFVGFLNATLRKLEDKRPTLPLGDTPEALSTRLSYPLFFVEALLKDYSLESTKEILDAQNRPSPTMVRVRNRTSTLPEGLKQMEGIPVAIVTKNDILTEIAASPKYYIQNGTPVILIEKLSQGIKTPKRILDLCASPGGKLLAIHDQFPDAQLTANDISEEKLKTLKENISKYGLEVEVTCSLGEQFKGKNKYDLIILDVPCSNSGVLNKRPEARWRLSDAHLRDLEATQLRLAQHAATLLADGGQIWYMTCSILKRENEEMVSKICQQTSLKPQQMVTVLPNLHGLDGGFACSLEPHNR